MRRHETEVSTPPQAPQSPQPSQMHEQSRHGIVPPYLLARIAQIESPRLHGAATAARATLLLDAPLRSNGRTRVTLSIDGDALIAELGPGVQRTVSDAENGERLPGVVVRTEGQPPVADTAVNEVYSGLGASFEFFLEALGRLGITDRDGNLRASVHFGDRYDNAFWDGQQMVFGDGDGEIFAGFTQSLSVLAHELAHGVIEHTAGLKYQGQSGALNESCADVFGALAEQFERQQTAAEASWLIGEGLFTKAVQGVALRSLRAPGTAYDDDMLGQDPQPGHMDDYVETSEDNGGVHINSGIPNRAFYEFAVALGGFAWERAGTVWYATLLSGIAPDLDFAAFASATIAVASEEYGESSAEVQALRAAWEQVGVAASAPEPSRAS